MATLSATASAAQPNANVYCPPVGYGVVYGQYDVTASLSVGDVIHMLKIPSGVVVTDFSVSVDGMSAGSVLKINVGDNASRNCYFASASIASGLVYRMQNPAGLNREYSAGSSTTNHVISLTADTASSLSTSMTIKMNVGFRVK